jgi:predicted transglutaminase-like cysteine proteinase
MLYTLFMTKSILLTLTLLLQPLCFADERPKRLNLETYKTQKRKPYVADFCNRHSIECDRSGKTMLAHSKELIETLNRVNREVNEQIEFTLDTELYEKEEYWNLPETKGDCEDNALEKRRRLAKLGLSRGSMSMATAFHATKFYAHALLLVETSEGTFVLDQDNEEVVLWRDAPYIFEARELTNGRWERFVQEWNY